MLLSSGVINSTEKDGVRDEVYRYIESNYKKREHVNAVIQMAVAMQKSLIVDTNNIADVRSVHEEVIASINCIYLRFDRKKGDKNPATVSSEIESLTVNTKQRTRVYLAYNKALDGTSWSESKGDTCVN